MLLYPHELASGSRDTHDCGISIRFSDDLLPILLVPWAFDSLGNLGHLCATRRGHVLVDPAIAVPFGCMWRGAKSMKVMHSIYIYV